MRKFNFKKGKHFSRPRLGFTALAINQHGFNASFRFENDSYYENNISNYHQWNKMCGISYGLAEPNKDAIMVAYRCIDRKFYIGIYTNKNYEKYLPLNFIEIPIHFNVHVLCLIDFKTERATVRLSFDDLHDANIVAMSNGLTLDCGAIELNVIAPQPKFLGTYRQPYHGGQATPLNDYSVYMKYN